MDAAQVWRSARESATSAGLATSPVGLVVLSKASALVQIFPIIVVPQMMDIMRHSPTFQRVSSLTGITTIPVDVASLMEMINKHIRADDKNKLSLRTEMTPEDVHIMRDAASGNPAATILKEKMARDSMYQVLYHFVQFVFEEIFEYAKQVTGEKGLKYPIFFATTEQHHIILKLSPICEAFANGLQLLADQNYNYLQYAKLLAMFIGICISQQATITKKNVLTAKQASTRRPSGTSNQTNGTTEFNQAPARGGQTGRGAHTTAANVGKRVVDGGKQAADGGERAANRLRTAGRRRAVCGEWRAASSAIQAGAKRGRRWLSCARAVSGDSREAQPRKSRTPGGQRKKDKWEAEVLSGGHYLAILWHHELYEMGSEAEALWTYCMALGSGGAGTKALSQAGLSAHDVQPASPEEQAGRREGKEDEGKGQAATSTSVTCHGLTTIKQRRPAATSAATSASAAATSDSVMGDLENISSLEYHAKLEKSHTSQFLSEAADNHEK
ncbi:hypothetical protein GGX14DRAFT_404774 [Mycena pura]|uniref:DUF8205 domain-containing protein n=1 Tax=Mycena pura TaxID=153505 RepID=A0AAD6XZT6_9AGAR|nr:hypothetical protein GGX14DRAFT_404774 [Mycena pura]